MNVVADEAPTVILLPMDVQLLEGIVQLFANGSFSFLGFFSHSSPNLVCLRCLKGAKHSTLESPFFFLALSSIFIMHTSISMNSRCLPLFLLAGAGL